MKASLFSDDLADPRIRMRREAVYLILAGIFLGSLTMLNILGISRFIDLSFTVMGTEIPFIVAIGVLPYPITFLCTDLISELFGRQRANLVVWVGLVLNFWVILVMWLGGFLDAPETLGEDGLPTITVDASGQPQVPGDYAFYYIRQLTFGAVIASMLAYMTAQFADVHVFHYLKRRTRGRHLWLRNNVSTLTSQLIDSVAVILITHYYAGALTIDPSRSEAGNLLLYIGSAYVFKAVAALLDTIPVYLMVRWLSAYMKVDVLAQFRDESSKAS
jgi:hypothetical protein